MKQLIQLLLILLPVCLKAQESPMQHVMEHIDFSEVTSGFLWDVSPQLIDLEKLDGQSIDDSNRMTINTYGTAYATVFGSCIDEDLLPPAPDAYMAAVNNASLSASVPITVAAFHYHKMLSSGLDDGLFTYDGEQLHDVPNRPTNPYQAKTTFFASTVLNATIFSTMSFHIPSSLYLSNFSETVTSLELDLGDGNGYQTVNFDESIAADYGNFIGETQIAIRFTYNDGSVYQAHCVFAILEIPEAEETVETRYDDDANDIFTIDGPALNGLDSVFIFTLCGGDNTEIRKPFIFVEGFNPDFDDLGFSNQKPKHMIDQLDFTIGGRQLITHLENSGYDLIYVDFNNPTASIQDNAAVLQAVIEEVNNRKALNGSFEKNVVFGESMGGLISKYTLLDMENSNIEHETEILMTFDSPLRGANIPLGMQQLACDVNDFKVSLFLNLGTILRNFVPLVYDAGRVIASPGVRQMLINHIYHEEGQNVHKALMAEIDAFGPPQDFKLFAISNGSNSGVLQRKLDEDNTTSETETLQEGDRMIKLDIGSGDIANVISECVNLGGVEELLLIGEFGEEIITTILPFMSNSLAKVEANIYAMKTTPNEKIYDFEVTNYLFHFIPIKIEDKELKTDPDRFDLIALDNAPGGISPNNPDPKLFQLEDVQAIAGDNLELVTIDAINFCFIPTVSALDLVPPNDLDPYFDVSDEETILEDGLTVSDRFIASPDDSRSSFGVNQENQEHVTFHPRNAQLFLFALISRDDLIGALAGNDGDLTQTFNFGRASLNSNPNVRMGQTHNIVSYSMSISEGGKLWANRQDRIGFINNINNPQSDVPSHFDLHFQKGRCDDEADDVIINITDTGEMTIGEWAADGVNTSDVYLWEDVTFNVRGKIEIDNNSRFIIKSGAEVIIESGGLLDCSWNAQVIVEAGGILRVENNGQLRPSNNGQIWVQPGGQLILNGGAQVQLWAGSGPDAIEDAPCNIKLGGPIIDPDNTPDVAELVLDGQFEYSGTGYFDFHRNANVELVGDTDFAIDGYAKGYRFLKLSDGAHLNINKNECRLRNGEVEYTSSSQIDLTGEAAGRFSQVEFTGHPNSTAIVADRAQSVFIGGSSFSNFEVGVSARLLTDYYLDENVFIFESDFSNCKRGVHAEGLDNIRIWNTEMNLTNSDLIGFGEGVHLEIVNNCYLTNSRIGNYDIGLEMWGATDFVMNGGNIHDNRIGIFLQDDIADDVELALTNSTVDLIGKATLENNITGIFGVAGDYIPNEGPYPMITLDCARLIENVIGIRGRDLLLNMDGSSEVAPNVLIENPDFSKSKILELCYYKLNLGGTPIGATNNYWGESPPNIFRYITQENGQIGLTGFCKMELSDGYDDFNSINVGSGNVTLDFSDFLEEEPTGCGRPGEPTGTGTGSGGNDDKVYTPLKPTDAYHKKVAECLAPNERGIYEDYWQAYATYLSEVERSTADHSESRDAFSPIAKLGEDKKAKYSGFCRMLIEKARSRAGNNIFRSSGSQYTNVYKVDRASVYPNPTEHRLYVKTEKNLFSDYQIVDVMGEMWQNGSIEADAVETKVEVSNLPPGVYMIQLKGKETHWKTIRFVVSE